MKTSARPKEGLFLGLTFGLIVVLGTVFFFKKWLPDLASDRVEIDHLFYTILIMTGIVFILVQGITGYFIWRYSDPTPERAVYLSHSRSLEITWTTVTALLMLALGVWGLSLWKNVTTGNAPSKALAVEITGQQFQWNIRYPGPDSKFGRVDPHLISDDNALGLDPKDKASKDDVVVQDDLYLVVNRPAIVTLRSKDVIHSFFLPNFRVKQDAVPGMSIDTWFTPTKIGDYEIACAQFCGLGHYTMRGMVHVLSQEQFDQKMKELGHVSYQHHLLTLKGE